MDEHCNWKGKEKIIDWEIHSHYYYDKLYCKGATVFEQAMGGRGLQAHFLGELEWKGKVLSLSLGMLGWHFNQSRRKTFSHK